jgi:hypothetical protein
MGATVGGGVVTGLNARTVEVGVAAETSMGVPVKAVLSLLPGAADTAFGLVGDAVSTQTEAIATDSQTQWAGIETDTTGVWDALGIAAATQWEALKTTINTAIGTLATDLGLKWDAIKTTALTAWKGLKDDIPIVLQNIADAILEFDMYQLGLDFMMGFENGVRASFNALVAAIRGVFTDLLTFCKHILELESPSKVMRSMGELTMEGFALGIESQGSLVTDSVAGVISSALGSGQKLLDGGMLSLNGSLAGQQVYGGMGATSINNNRNITVEVNPTYRNYESEAGIYYNVTAALAAVRL